MKENVVIFTQIACDAMKICETFNFQTLTIWMCSGDGVEKPRENKVKCLVPPTYFTQNLVE